MQEVVTTARASSAPGPGGVLYKVYKCCPELCKALWIPKEKSTKLEQFWTMSFLIVEEKIFISILARRLTDYLLKNAYIDTLVLLGHH